MGAKSVGDVLVTLTDQNKRKRRKAVEELCQHAYQGDLPSEQRTAAVEPLIAACRDEDSQVRRRALAALAHLGVREESQVEKVLTVMVAALRDEDSGVRDAAAYFLDDFWLKDPRAITPLATALNDEEKQVRRSAAQTLAKYGRGRDGPRDERAVEPLVAALTDKDEFVRSHIASALGWLGDARAVGPLTKALSDQSVPRLTAATALAHLGAGDRALDTLIAAVGQGDQWVRSDAIAALGWVNDPRAVDALTIIARDDKDLSMRLAANRALGELAKLRPASEAATGRRAYLILLWDTEAWSETEKQQIIAQKSAELGCPAELIKTVRVSGGMPHEPDTFVTATALLACEAAGVDFESDRDAISFSGGEYRPGVGLGVISVVINSAS